MASLRVYSKPDGGEYVVIVSDEGEDDVDALTEGDTLEVEIDILGERITSFPTDRILRQE